MQTILRAMSAFVLIAILTACNNGGSSGSATSSQPNIATAVVTNFMAPEVRKVNANQALILTADIFIHENNLDLMALDARTQEIFKGVYFNLNTFDVNGTYVSNHAGGVQEVIQSTDLTLLKNHQRDPIVTGLKKGERLSLTIIGQIDDRDDIQMQTTLKSAIFRDASGVEIIVHFDITDTVMMHEDELGFITQRKENDSVSSTDSQAQLLSMRYNNLSNKNSASLTYMEIECLTPNDTTDLYISVGGFRLVKGLDGEGYDQQGNLIKVVYFHIPKGLLNGQPGQHVEFMIEGDMTTSTTPLVTYRLKHAYGETEDGIAGNSEFVRIGSQVFSIN